MKSSDLTFSDWLPWITGLLFVTSLILLGGGVFIGSQAFILCFIGLSLLLFPPQLSLSKPFNFCIALLIGWLLVSFIPLPDFLRSDWLVNLEKEYGFSLASSITPQPLLSWECLLLLLAGVGWFHMVLNWSTGHRIRKGMFWVIAITTALLGAGLIVGQVMDFMYPITKESILEIRSAYHFTYFPNRNQTAFILAIGGVLAFGLSMDALKRKHMFSLLAAFCLTCLHFAALTMAISRAGILLWVLGCALLSIQYLRKPEKLRYSIIAICTVGLLFFAFLVSGTQASQRVKHTLINLDLDGGYRVLIYQDSLDLLLDYWLTGTGLGNYPYVFPQYAKQLAEDKVVIHPESDWLWFATETGLIGLILLGTLVFIALKQMSWRFTHHKGKTLRLTGSAILILFALHTLLDVSGHRFASFALPVMVFGLARNAYNTIAFPAYVRWLWRGVGMILIYFGIQWGLAAYNNTPTHHLIIHDQLNNSAQLIKEDRIDEIKAITQEANKHLPLNWKTQFYNGILELKETRDMNKVDAWFKRTLALNMDNESIPFSIARMLSLTDPKRSYDFFKFSLEKTHKDKKPGKFTTFLSSLKTSSNVQRFYYNQAWVDYPQYALSLLNAAPLELKETLFYMLLEDYTSFSKRSTHEQEAAFNILFQARQYALIKDALAKQPSLAQAMPFTQACMLAQDKDYEASCKQLIKITPKPTHPWDQPIRTPEAKLHDAFKENPKDANIARQWVTHLIKNNRWSELQTSITQVLNHRLNIPNLHYWLFFSYLQEDNYESAWKHGYLHYRSTYMLNIIRTH